MWDSDDDSRRPMRATRTGPNFLSAAVVGGDNDNNITISHKRGGGENEGYGGCKGEGSQASKARVV